MAIIIFTALSIASLGLVSSMALKNTEIDSTVKVLLYISIAILLVNITYSIIAMTEKAEKMGKW